MHLDIRRIASGFTLIELLISLSILSMLLVIVFSGLRMGVRAWEKGEANIDIRQRERVILLRMRDQIQAMHQRPLRQSGKRPWYPEAGNGSLQFVTRLGFLPENRGQLVRVTYRVMPDADEAGSLQLAYHEQVVIDPDDETLDSFPEDDRLTVLFSGIGGFSFDFMARSSDTGVRWNETWKPEGAGQFPAAVRLTYLRRKDESKDAAPLFMFCRLPEVDI